MVVSKQRSTQTITKSLPCCSRIGSTKRKILLSFLLSNALAYALAFTTTTLKNHGTTRRKPFIGTTQHLKHNDCWSSDIHGVLSMANNNGNENVDDASRKTTNKQQPPKASYDVVIVGSGIGGLTAAAMLSKYGYSVAVFESHYESGGCAHGYQVYDKKIDGTYTFDTGPSFFSGLNPTIPAKASNPLRTVLEYINESVECIPYTSFGLKFPEGDFLHTPGFGKQRGDARSNDDKSIGNVIEHVSGVDGTKQWEKLLSDMGPIEDAVAAMPTAALRGDIGAAITAASFLPNFATISPFAISKLTKPFSNVIDSAGVTDPFVKNWLDLLCFCLSGLPADGTITAEMGMMMGEFYDPSAIMDCPKGGARKIVDALVRGIEKNGGSIFLKSHVETIHIDPTTKKATGISLKKSNVGKITAEKAVISNLSVWDLFSSGIVDTNVFPKNYISEKLETPIGKSFMHLHIGFRITKDELSKLQAHYMYIDDWSRGVDAEDNASLVSIPSVHDPTLAPNGYAVLHCYTPATEDFSKWENIKRGSDEYKQLKEERSKFLWKVLESIIPDIRDRATTIQIGTPLTHRRFLRRYKGSYGPAIKADEGSFPFPTTPIKGLLLCGDSCFPGIGVPAVAGSGILAANTVSFDSIKPQLELLETFKM